MGLKINLGCGKHVMEGWENLDPRTGLAPGIKQWAWDKPIPFPDGSAELVIAQHNTNHCRPENFDANMREVLRVLAPGGKLVLKDADDRYFVWRRVGTKVDGGKIYSTLSAPKAEEIMRRNGFVDVTSDKDVLVGKYRSVLTRLERTRNGTKFFVVEGTKPTGGQENGSPEDKR
jgi:predicted SAM-dependent methyltransferase